MNNPFDQFSATENEIQNSVENTEFEPIGVQNRNIDESTPDFTDLNTNNFNNLSDGIDSASPRNNKIHNDNDVIEDTNSVTSMYSINCTEGGGDIINKKVKKEKKVSEESINAVRKWVKVDDQIRIMSKQLKQLKNEKKQLSPHIFRFFEELGDDKISISGGKLRKSVSKTKIPLNTITLQHTLKDALKDGDQAQKLVQYIMSNRSTKETIRIKRTSNRDTK